MKTGYYTTKIDLAIETLRQAIIDGDLKPGSRLRQEELANRFGISPTPIREALRRLQAEGLVVTEPHKGTRVAPFDVNLTREIYMIRGVLEGLAARLAAQHVTPEIIRRMEQEQQKLSEALEQGDSQAMRRSNYEFHTILYAAADSPVLMGLIESLMARSPYDSLWVKPERAAESLLQHERILQAIRNGDSDQAQLETQYHIQSIGAFLINAMGNKTVEDLEEDQN